MEAKEDESAPANESPCRPRGRGALASARALGLRASFPAFGHDRGQARYFFCVERYFEDFIAAARQLHAQLLSDPRPVLPPELAGRV